MTKKEEEKMVEDLIIESLIELCDLSCEYCRNEETEIKSKIIFPQKRKNRDEEKIKNRYCKKKKNNDCNRRVSEQEAKVLFIKNMQEPKYEGFLYSVETPTKRKYSFSKNETETESSKSGNIDICLHENNGERKHLIEFKANNTGSYFPDFVKLLYDNERILTNYFVHVLENSKKGTIKSVVNKYNNAIYECKEWKEDKDNQSKIKVFLCIMAKKSIRKYEVDIDDVDQKNDVKNDDNEKIRKKINSNITVVLTPENQLKNALADINDLKEVTKLTVKGTSADPDSDSDYIRENLSNSLELDMSDAFPDLRLMRKYR